MPIILLSEKVFWAVFCLIKSPSFDSQTWVSTLDKIYPILGRIYTILDQICTSLCVPAQKGRVELGAIQSIL